MSAAAPNSDAASKVVELRGQLQRKKEELYTLLDMVERAEHHEGLRLTWWDRLDRHRNLKLLRRLSVQIHPKPGDPRWRWYRGQHCAAFCVKSVLAGVAVGYMLGLDKEEDGQDDDEEKEVEDGLSWMRQLKVI